MSGSQAPLINPYFDLHARLAREPEALRSELRKKLIWAYSWAIPSEEAVRALADFAPDRRVLEIGAGTGYWAWLLRQAGVDCLAVDRDPDQPPTWFSIAHGEASASSLHPDRMLLLCWPPCDNELASEALNAFGGSTLAYVGELSGGRTATNAFFKALSSGWRLERTVELPRWPGFTDRLELYRRVAQ